jgi:hypothetical protein
LKKFTFILFLFCVATSKAQQVDSIYVNLYTDSLKKGTYNYINIDGLLSNGNYIPLDSSDLIFKASAGDFFGNSLFIDSSFAGEKVSIRVALKKNSAIFREFDVYIKKKADDELLKTTDEILSEMRNGGRKKKNK